MYSQNNEDFESLVKLEYMKITKGIDCENTTGTTIETRVCLNLKFQKYDSILNHRFKSYLEKVKNDTLKLKIKTFQEEWFLIDECKVKYSLKV